MGPGINFTDSQLYKGLLYHCWICIRKVGTYSSCCSLRNSDLFTSAKKCRDNLTVLKVSLAISSPLFLPNWMRFHDETLSLYLGCLAKSTHNIPIVKTFKQSESNNWLLLLSCKMPFLLHEISFEIYFLCL